MPDTTITIPAPFAMGYAHNRISCLMCGQDSYSSEFFGSTLDQHLRDQRQTNTHWLIGMVHLNKMLGPEDMQCPKCGAKSNGSFGNRISNFMATEDFEHECTEQCKAS